MMSRPLNIEDLKERVEQKKQDIETMKQAIKNDEKMLKSQDETLDRLNMQRVKQVAILDK